MPPPRKTSRPADAESDRPWTPRRGRISLDEMDHYLGRLVVFRELPHIRSIVRVENVRTEGGFVHLDAFVLASELVPSGRYVTPGRRIHVSANLEENALVWFISGLHATDLAQAMVEGVSVINPPPAGTRWIDEAGEDHHVPLPGDAD
jgi:hypothetical protein